MESHREQSLSIADEAAEQVTHKAALPPCSQRPGKDTEPHFRELPQLCSASPQELKEETHFCWCHLSHPWTTAAVSLPVRFTLTAHPVVSLPVSVLYDQCSTSDPLTQIRGSLDLSTGFPVLCLPPPTHTQERPLLVILLSYSKILTEFLLTIPQLSQTPWYTVILAGRRTGRSKLSSSTTLSCYKGLKKQKLLTLGVKVMSRND